jgi:hypothetical protein
VGLSILSSSIYVFKLCTGVKRGESGKKGKGFVLDASSVAGEKKFVHQVTQFVSG